MNEADIAKALRGTLKATKWPKDQPDHAIGTMVVRGKRSAGKKKAAGKSK